jgi:hypothetical protein
MNRHRHRDRPSEAELAALADGSLPPEKRARVERAVAASAELRAELQLQRYALDAVNSAAGERAPAGLRARITLAEPPRRRSRPLRVFATAGTAALAAVLVVVLVLAGGPSGAPSVADASVLGARPAVGGITEARDGSPTLARPRAAGLRFPDWQYRFGWHAIGSRVDRLGARAAVTVFYRHRNQVIAYTIVGGRPLPVGAQARTTIREGVVLRALGVGGRRVVSWVRGGHTCIVSAKSMDTPTLLRLAAWNHGGAIAD